MPITARILFLLLALGGLSALPACPGDAVNRGDRAVSAKGVTLQEAMLASGELDAALMMWESVLTPVGIELAADGEWDTLEDAVVVPDSCIEQRFSLGTTLDWFYRHTWTVDGCRSAGDGFEVVSRESGTVRWQAGTKRFSSTIDVPLSEQAYSDGETVRRRALARFHGGRPVGSSPLAVTAAYSWRVSYEATTFGAAVWGGSLRMLGSGVGLYDVTGEWSWTRDGESVVVQLRNAVIDYSKCPILDPLSGEPMAGQAPLMPNVGRATIQSPEGEFELAWGGCAATLLQDGAPMAWFPADTPETQLDYLMAFYGVVPGMWIMHRSHMSSLNLALVTRQWCEVTGPCHRFEPRFDTSSLILAGPHVTAATAADETTAAAGRWYAVNESLLLVDSAGNEAGYYAADLTDTLVLTPIAVSPGSSTLAVTWTSELLPAPQTIAGSPPRHPLPYPQRWALPAMRPETFGRNPGFAPARREY